MIREGRPGVRMEHPLDDRAVATGGLAPNPTPGNAVLRFDVRDDFVAQVVIVLPRRGRIDVLVAADSGEAVDHRTIIAPIFPVRMRRSSFVFRSSPSGSIPKRDFPVPVYPTIPYAAGYRFRESYFGGR